MTTFAIATLGCKVNTYESQGYENTLLDMGYQEVLFKEKADVYIINTCAVTNTAAAKSRQKIHQAIALNANALIVVVGCYVQTSSDTIKENEHVDILVGSDGKHEIPTLIEEALHGKRKQKIIHDVRGVSVFESLPVRKFEHQTRAFLKIQDGCNQFCSYCIIPYARGAERFLPEDEVIRIAQNLVDHGHKEIVLSGIHTGRYGHGSGRNLCDLLKRMVRDVKGLQRIRISSIEMNEVSDELLDFMQVEKKIARHLHIPIQSANNKVLKNMHRPYMVEWFMKRVENIRSRMPEINISSDVIVGFPQESEEEFLDTMHHIKEMKLTFLHVFPYSKRDGTVAASMKGHLDNKVKKKRAASLGALSKQLYTAYKKSFVGKEVTVIFEKEKEHMYIGHSSEYLEVAVLGSKELLHTMQKVTITAINDDDILEGYY